jgi:hypothetical protein
MCLLINMDVEKFKLNHWIFQFWALVWAKVV